MNKEKKQPNQNRPETPELETPVMPQAPLPQAPLPQAPLPQAPLPQAPLPDAPLPDEGEGGVKVVNLTRQELKVIDKAGNTVAIYPPSGETADVATDTIEITPLPNGVRLYSSTFGRTYGLPKDESPDTIYIVPSFVLAANRHRKDVFAPYKLKFEGGKPVYCEGFTR